jgi:hypothetical protein
MFVGFQLAPGRRRLKNRNVRSFLRRLIWMWRALRERRLTSTGVQKRLMGWFGHAAQADCFPLVARLVQGLVFREGQFQAFH